MGLFDKKYCDICGEKIGLLGNRKLENGNLCKNCAKKLSPWFSDRRSSTVEEIKSQLAYREENQEKVAAFHTTRTLGTDTKVLLDEDAGKFMVTRARNLVEANPDVLDFADVTGCNLDIDESRSELKREDKDGNEVSYNPPRYEYSYDFYITIFVNNPYFNEMRFKVNSSSVDITPPPAVASYCFSSISCCILRRSCCIFCACFIICIWFMPPMGIPPRNPPFAMSNSPLSKS